MAVYLRFVFNRLSISSTQISKTNCYVLQYGHVKVANPFLLIQPVRYTSNFLTKLAADFLWKGVTSVSSAGAKSGRNKGSSRRRATDLNRGQELGDGKLNIQWPGLNVPVLKGRELVERHQLPPNPEKQAKILKLRRGLTQFRRPTIAPLDRGWSGKKMPGRRIGPPTPVGECNFEGFDTIVLEFKAVSHATKIATRNRTISAIVVTGNGNGVLGFGRAKSKDGKAALVKAKLRAAKRFEYFERFEDRTVFHNLFAQIDRTKLIIKKKGAGYGLFCHRGIKAMCERVGIKDLYVKLEGAVNMIKIVKAFFQALRKQETHQDLANRSGLYVIELCTKRGFFPKILAKPEGPVRKEINKDEITDLNIMYSENRLEFYKPPPPPFYANYHWHLKTSFDKLRFRNKAAYKIEYRVNKELNELRMNQPAELIKD